MAQRGSFEIIRKGNDVWASLDDSLTEWVNSQFGIKLSADIWIHGTPTHPLMRGQGPCVFADWVGSPGDGRSWQAGPDAGAGTVS
ncbi:hypothetical protein ACWCQP_50710, partial [Streptomyces chartreusis]